MVEHAPPAGLTREAVLDAALEFVGAHGVAELSVYRLADHFGVEVTALCEYVPNNDALLDGLVERVTGLVEPELVADPRTQLCNIATGFRAVLLRHPGVVPLVATRSVRTAPALAAAEHALAVLHVAGLSAALALDAYNAVMTFVIGHVLAEAGYTPGHEDAEPDPYAMPAELDADRFPLLVQAFASGAGVNHEQRFQRAVTALVNGMVDGV